MSMLLTILPGYLAAVSLAAFCLYGIDKHRAVHGRWRIPEKVLILAAFLGGAAGALFGMLVFHHKTRKPKFRILVPLALLLWCLLLGYLLAGKGKETLSVTSSSLTGDRKRGRRGKVLRRPQGGYQRGGLAASFCRGPWTTELAESSLGADA